jgi:acyl-coenzyme A thioesterase PaaI-like protein
MVEPRGTKLVNPYANREGYDDYNCFGCAPENQFGLHMEFYSDGRSVWSTWDPEGRFQGFHGILHGGIQATLMDEVASWVVSVVLGTSGFTKTMQVDYLENVLVDGPPLVIRGEVGLESKKEATLDVELYQGQSLKARAVCCYAIFSEAVARKKLHYPGRDAFFP